MDHDYSTMPRSQTPPPLSPTSGFFKVEVPISSTVGVRDEAAKTVEGDIITLFKLCFMFSLKEKKLLIFCFSSCFRD